MDAERWCGPLTRPAYAGCNYRRMTEPPEREWMGVEPTAARSARPATDFEDQGAHRDTTTPICLQQVRKL